MLRTALVIATVCATGIVIYSPSVRAQCAARDALNTTPPRASSVVAPAAVHKAAAIQNVWKTVALGEFPNSFALRNALDAATAASETWPGKPSRDRHLSWPRSKLKSISSFSHPLNLALRLSSYR